jgi:hypothetical protein
MRVTWIQVFLRFRLTREVGAVVIYRLGRGGEQEKAQYRRRNADRRDREEAAIGAQAQSFQKKKFMGRTLIFP